MGDRIRRLLWSQRGMAILDPWQCGWNDGGCGILAAATAAWLGESARPVAIVARGRVQHVLTACGELYVDGDGLSTDVGLLRRWKEVEMLPDVAILDPWHDNPALGVETPRDPAASAAMVKLLRDLRLPDLPAPSRASEIATAISSARRQVVAPDGVDHMDQDVGVAITKAVLRSAPSAELLRLDHRGLA